MVIYQKNNNDVYSIFFCYLSLTYDSHYVSNKRQTLHFDISELRIMFTCLFTKNNIAALWCFSSYLILIAFELSYSNFAIFLFSFVTALSSLILIKNQHSFSFTVATIIYKYL